MVGSEPRRMGRRATRTNGGKRFLRGGRFICRRRERRRGFGGGIGGVIVTGTGREGGFTGREGCIARGERSIAGGEGGFTGGEGGLTGGEGCITRGYSGLAGGNNRTGVRSRPRRNRMRRWDTGRLSGRGWGCRGGGGREASWGHWRGRRGKVGDWGGGR